jgi:hypothetical protein
MTASSSPSDPFLPQLEGYEVRRIPSFRATKGYACPGCHNPIPPGTGHVVAWPLSLVDDRRHWHLHCWRVVARRGRIA